MEPARTHGVHNACAEIHQIPEMTIDVVVAFIAER